MIDHNNITGDEISLIRKALGLPNHSGSPTHNGATATKFSYECGLWQELATQGMAIATHTGTDTVTFRVTRAGAIPCLDIDESINGATLDQLPMFPEIKANWSLAAE